MTFQDTNLQIGGKKRKHRRSYRRSQRKERSNLSKAGSIFGFVAITWQIIGSGIGIIILIGAIIFINVWNPENSNLFKPPPNFPNNKYNNQEDNNMNNFKHIKYILNIILPILLVITIIIFIVSYKYRNNKYMKGFAGMQLVGNIIHR